MIASPQASPTPVAGRPEPGEAFFRQSIADLSKRLGERAARDSSAEPQAAVEARRRAMQAYERERARKLRLVLTGAAAVFATAGFAWAVVLIAEPESLPPPLNQIASVQTGPTSEPPAAPPTTTASAAPVIQPQSAPRPQPMEPSSAAPAVTESQTPAVPFQADPLPPAPPSQVAAAPPSEPLPQAQPAPAVPSPAPVLGREEIREVQKRLRGFGFNPGPVDGVAGRQTEIATQRYLETRGQPQLPPNDPQLLAQLREDSAPQLQPSAQASNQVAQRPAQPDNGYSGYSTQPSAASQQQPRRYSSVDPFQPVKAAGAQITRWLEGVFRAPASN